MKGTIGTGRSARSGCGSNRLQIEVSISHSVSVKKRRCGISFSRLLTTARVWSFHEGEAPFVEHVVGRKAIVKHPAHSASISLMALSPAKATPVNDGGAGIGGPLSRFWLQLRN